MSHQGCGRVSVMGGRRARPAGSAFADVVVGLGLLVVLLLAVLPAVVRVGGYTANRVKCANNLSQIGKGMLIYANDNNGVLPRLPYKPGVAPDLSNAGADDNDPFTSKALADKNNVPAVLYLLSRMVDLTMGVFICPDSGARPVNWGSTSIMDHSNFPGKPVSLNLSYSIQNPYADITAVEKGFKWIMGQKIGAEFVVAADMNPGGDALLKLTTKSPASEMHQGNSRNHDRQGQNVLYGDGHVQFQATPFCGVKNDNIYTFGPSGEEGGGKGVIGSPAGPEDSILLPVAEPLAAGEPADGPPAAAPSTAPAAPRAASQPAGGPQARGRFGWTLEEARGQLALNPRDPYLQYVLLQLGLRAGEGSSAAREVETFARLGANRRSFDVGSDDEPRNGADLFSLFTGSLAVQESLQLDTMRGGRGPTTGRNVNAPSGPAASPGTVALTDLRGPQVRSHPWAKMLAGRKPPASVLSRCVPEDFYLIEFRSLAKLADLADGSDLWASHLLTQASREARTQDVGRRLRAQLAVETNPLLRPFYDAAVEGVALTGSDLFLREGSDLTLLFQIKSPLLFHGRMDSFLEQAAKSRPDAVRSTGKIGDVDYVAVVTPDRSLSVYSAYPRPDLHVRGNSKPALERVLAVIAGGGEARGPARSLGDSDEFAYVRTIFAPGAPEEDGLIYLSDPFIRRLVGPRVKLTERRRLVCYNHLRMIGHAAQMYRTETGKAPESLQALADAGCAPGLFGKGALACPDGGTYGLATDPATGAVVGTCSVHGRADCLTPCLELPLQSVSAEEGKEYGQFVEAYNQYWRQFFDPIALRVKVTPERYRLETLILPLIDNSIYTSMAQALGGRPEALDALPVPPRTIFSVASHVDKARVLQQLPDERAEATTSPATPEGTATTTTGGRKVTTTVSVKDGVTTHVTTVTEASEPAPTTTAATTTRAVPTTAANAPRPSATTAATRPGDDDARAAERREEEEERAGSGPDDMPRNWMSRLKYRRFMAEGLGDTVALHVYDSPQTFDFNLPQFFALVMESGRGGGWDSDFRTPMLAALITSLNSPVYLSAPVKNAKVVDEFLAELDEALAGVSRVSPAGDLWFFSVGQDFYRLGNGQRVRCHALKLGPITWRFFWARIGDGLYVASKAYILDDLVAADATAAARGAKGAAPGAAGASANANAAGGASAAAGPDPDATGHAMARVRADHWKEVLADYRLSWAESDRAGCLDNLGPLSSAARAWSAANEGRATGPADANRAVRAMADRLYGVHFFCPEGGEYVLSPDGKEVTCTVHGSALAPTQPPAPLPASPIGRLLSEFRGLTATLTFLPDGLRAVVTVDRAGP